MTNYTPDNTQQLTRDICHCAGINIDPTALIVFTDTDNTGETISEQGRIVYLLNYSQIIYAVQQFYNITGYDINVKALADTLPTNF